jgi:DNA-binding NarL/FixJ family response regulator
MEIRAVIVDDNQDFLDSATRVLESDGLEVVGTASTSAEALRIVDELRPQAVLVDVELGDEDGVELARQLSAAQSAVAVILISTHPEEDVADLIVGSPAVGFLAKSKLSVDAVRALLA